MLISSTSRYAGFLVHFYVLLLFPELYKISGIPHECKKRREDGSSLNNNK